MESIDFLVRVSCMTYNHAPYIVDAMNGFTMQQTSFPFVCIIVDDASTDGEPEVISNYMLENFDLADKKIAIEEETDDYRLMFARHKSNQNCYFVAVLLKYNHYSINKPKHPYYMRWVGAKYIAMCEGDDYWIAPDKLQKQVSFLDGHEDYSFSCTGFDFLHQSTHEIISGEEVTKANLSIINEDKDICLSILDGTLFRIQTMTVVYRTSSYNKYSALLKKQGGLFLMNDTQTWVYLLKDGKLHYLPDNTAIYRLNEGSACRQKTIKNRVRFDLSCAEMKVYMADEINAPQNYKVKFQKYYQKKLNIYYCYDKDYKPFVRIEFYSLKDRIMYYVLKSFIVRPFFKMIYENHYRKLLAADDASFIKK